MKNMTTAAYGHFLSFFFFSFKVITDFPGLHGWFPKLSSADEHQTLLSNDTGAIGHDLGDFCLRLFSYQ